MGQILLGLERRRHWQNDLILERLDINILLNLI